jgi:hypothetical protein
VSARVPSTLQQSNEILSITIAIVMVEESVDKHVHVKSLTALETLRANGLLSIVDGSNDTKRISAWDEKVQFDEGGGVILIDIGGKRLYKGFPCPHEILSARHFPNLRTLNLAGTDLPIADILAILDEVKPHIETVFLGGNSIGVEGAKKLAESWLASARALLRLDLRYNDIGGVGMEAICKALVSTPVQHLYIEGNQIGDLGAAATAKLLEDPKSQLEQLFMGANEIQASGAQALASSLYVNKKISKIYLEGNKIGGEGADSFSSVLEELNGDTGLRNLFVDNNIIGKESSKRLAKALNSASAIAETIT